MSNENLALGGVNGAVEAIQPRARAVNTGGITNAPDHC